MKSNDVATVTHVSNAETEIRFSIDQSALGQAHLMKVMSNLYSDPRKAVIREYSTNARDSHIFAGCADRPIEVRLPTERHLFFEVQDFGLGLAVSDLGAYSVYGVSDKRDSDEVNGFLGLGCKSAFTYAESFNITSIKDGVKVLATVVKDADGVPTLKVLDTASTDLPNGVTISIPVRSHHVDNFAADAATFFRYWEPGTVLVDGEAPEFARDDVKAVWVDEDISVLPGGPSVIVMGNVAYPFRHSMNGLGITAWVPMGAVNFTPSREALHVTENTTHCTEAVEAYVKARLGVVVNERIRSLPAWERLQAVRVWRSHAKSTMAEFFAEFGLYPVQGNVTIYRTYTHGRQRKMDRGGLTWDALLDNPSAPIVLGYPHRTMTPMAKERLALVLGGREVTYLLSDIQGQTANFAGVEGRPGRIITWDEIVALSPDVKPQRQQRERQAFAYNVYHLGGFERTTDIPDVDDDGEATTILYTTSGNTHTVSLFPQAYIVELRSNQIDKFVRLYPEAEYAQDYYNNAREDAAAAIDETDRLYLSAAGHFALDLTHALGAAESDVVIADDDINLIALVRSCGESEALKTYKHLHGGYTTGIEAHPLPTEVAERYPLVSRSDCAHNSADVALYINAKHAALNANQEASK